MSASGVNQPSLLSNPFTNCKRIHNLDPTKTTVSNMPDEIATLIFSKMAIEKVEDVLDSTDTAMGQDRYSLYRNLVSAKSFLTGTELVKYQRLLSMEGQTLIAGQTPPLKSWSELLANHPNLLSELRYLDLSDSSNISDADLIALTKSSLKLTKLLLPGAFPSVEVMAVLRENCPRAAIYPSAMTEYDWTHPAEFMANLPPPPQAIADFINGPRPKWLGKTAAQAHMIVPRVNKIVRIINDRLVMVPWTLGNVHRLDWATGGPGCLIYVSNRISLPAIDKPPEVGFEWLVFTKDVLPQSRNQSYADQKQLTEHWGYEVPGFIDAATCMLWENRFSNNRIYSNPWTFTRCKEQVQNWQFIVGGFAPDVVTDGVFVYADELDNNTLGIGGVQKFSIK